MRKLICLIARARTGSNYIGDLLAKPGLVEYRDEVFHPKKTHGVTLDEVRLMFPDREIGARLTDTPDLVRKNPKRVLAHFKEERAASIEAVFFKVFPGHLEFDRFSKCILADDGVTKVILDRSPIDSFISLSKAQQLQQWDSVDTSELKIRLNAEHYVRWHQTNTKWLDGVIDILKSTGSKYSVLNYAELKIGDHDHNLALVLNKLQTAGLTLGGEMKAGDPYYVKQDRQQDLDKKVTNWHEFVNNLPNDYAASLHDEGFIKLDVGKRR